MACICREETMIEEHDSVVLRVDLPEHNLRAGDVGTVVHIYADSKAYEVEFFTLNGETLDIVTVEANQLRAVLNTEISHARPIK